MELYLQNIKKNENNVYVETYRTNNPRIASINVYYEGTEKDLDNFYIKILSDYMIKNKIIVD